MYKVNGEVRSMQFEVIEITAENSANTWLLDQFPGSGPYLLIGSENYAWTPEIRIIENGCVLGFACVGMEMFLDKKITKKSKSSDETPIKTGILSVRDIERIMKAVK